MPKPGQYKLARKRKRDKFLRLLEEHGDVQMACDETPVARSAAYRYREVDPEFAKAWDAAVDTGLRNRPKFVESSLLRMATRQIDVMEYNLRHVPVKDEDGRPTGEHKLKRTPKGIKSYPPSASVAIHLNKGYNAEQFGDRDKVVEERLKRVEVYLAMVDDFIERAQMKARLAGRPDFKVTREDAIVHLAKIRPEIREILGQHGESVEDVTPEMLALKP